MVYHLIHHFLKNIESKKERGDYTFTASIKSKNACIT